MGIPPEFQPTLNFRHRFLCTELDLLKHCFVHLHSMYRQMLKSTCKNSSQLTHGCTLVYGIVMIQPERILLSKVYRLLMHLIQHSISQTWKQLANHKEVQFSVIPLTKILGFGQSGTFSQIHLPMYYQNYNKSTQIKTC